MSKVEEPQGEYRRTPKKISLDDYLEMIADGTRRLEYHDGEVVDIQSATKAHGRICTNLTRLIDTCLLDKDCDIYAADRELWIPKCNKVFLPDHIIVCGVHNMIQMSKNVEATLNPSIVIEVLSDSTEKLDETLKSRCYKTIESLKQIVFVSQKMKYIRTVKRNKEGDIWGEYEYFEDDELVEIGDCKILLKEIYRRVDLEIVPNSASDIQKY
jgi:Uma2 family endonuclease